MRDRALTLLDYVQNAQQSGPPSIAIGRSLLDARDTQAGAAADADVTIVSTAAQLQAAIMEGAQDIQLRSHIDLSTLPLAFMNGPKNSLVLTTLGDVRASTRSIQVCSTSYM